MDVKINLRRKVADSRDRFFFRDLVLVSADDLLQIITDAEENANALNNKNRQIAHFVEAGNTQTVTIANLRQQVADLVKHNDALNARNRRQGTALRNIAQQRTTGANATVTRICNMADEALK